MENAKYFGFIFIIYTMVLGIGGCAATGGSFQNFQKPQNNTSVIYFYRPSNLIGFDALDSVYISEFPSDSDLVDTAVDKDSMWGTPEVIVPSLAIGKLWNNSHFRKEFHPGVHRIKVNSFLAPLEFDLKPNDYICLKVVMVTFPYSVAHSYPSLRRVDKNICKSEIKNTKEMTAEDQRKFY